MTVGSFVVASFGSTPYIYEGKEVFQTAKEYGSFKAVVGMSEVTIREIFVLSSEPPIVVDYLVEAPKSLGFPYGKRNLLPSSNLFSLLFALGLVSFVAGVGVLTGVLWD